MSMAFTSCNTDFLIHYDKLYKKMCAVYGYNMDRIDDKACDYYYAGMNMKYVTDYCIKY